MRIKSVLPALFLASFAVFATPKPALALSQLFLQEAGVNGGVVTLVGSAASFTPVSFSGTYGDFQVSIFGSTSHNAASQSDLLGAAVEVTNLTGTSTKTLTLFVQTDGYTLPVGPALQVTSGAGGTYEGPGTGAVVFQAYADKNNGVGAAGLTDFTNGLQAASPASGIKTTFDTGDVTGNFTRLGTPYSLTSGIQVTLTNVGACSSAGTACSTVNFSTHEIVTPVSAVPEPASMLLLGTGMVGLAGAAKRRFGRKK